MENRETVVNVPGKSGEVEIDLLYIMKSILHHIKAIVAVAVLGAILGAALTIPSISHSYSSSACFYVSYVSITTGTVGGNPYTTSVENLGPAGALGDTFGALLMQSDTLREIIEQGDLDCTVEDLSKMIGYWAESGRKLRVAITADSKQLVEAAAEAVADIMPEKLMDQVENCGVSVLDVQNAQETKTPPNSQFVKNAVMGAIVGAIAVCGVIFLVCVFDKHIHSAEYLSAAYPLVPLLTTLPDKKHAGGEAEEEAYKLLRTYLMFPGGGAPTAQVIGVTSSLPGEGKTDTAVNLARVLAQAGKKVLLMEGDMRHPALAERLSLQGFGLAASLAEAAPQASGLGFDAAVCGPAAADASALICSPQMDQTVEQMRGEYDYILLDLPAVMEAADAVAVSHMTDGMLMVVRTGKADYDSLAESMRRLRVADGRVLGFVYNNMPPAKSKH